MKNFFNFISRIFSPTKHAHRNDGTNAVRAGEFVELDWRQDSTPVKPVSSTSLDDSSVLDHNRSLWELGEWERLAQLDRQTMEYQPGREKLALLVAAAQLQLGQTANAKENLKLANAWGIDKKLVSRILIAGVHNSLGRACSVANAPQRALDHFKRSLEVGIPSATAESLGVQRGAREVAQLEGACGVRTATTTFMSRLGFPAGHSDNTLLAAIVDNQKKNSAELAAQVARQSEEIWKMKANLERSVAKEIFKATKQIESVLELQNYLNNGEMIGDFHGWPISPDFALYMVRILEREAYNLIVEFGSGTSTVLIAKSLEKIRHREEGSDVSQVAFEHLQKYFLQTGSNLHQVGLRERVQLHHTPLSDYVAPDQSAWKYYDCIDILDTIAISINAPRILVLVDGPPAATGNHARYPALPIMLHSFPGARIDILLDDYDRPDEKEIVQRWRSELDKAGRSYEVTEIPLEKGACYLSIQETIPRIMS